MPVRKFGGLTVDSGTVNVNAVASAHNLWLEIWTDNGSGSPSAQLGVDSDSINVSSAGEKAITWTTPVPLLGNTTFWIVMQVDGGDVNYNRHTTTVGTGVDGGDFDASAITSLVSAGTIIPRISVTLSDTTELGNKDTGTSAAGLSDAAYAMGLKITIP